ncbi:acidic fibroblast growth factor intracellular-binding protein [Tachypleus tridentatus]|uniref:acidic fibroblast growth factor intracellular-binding protein n=1 Tax=Tachypleus tridentatus TaxID=6853 RepID=UPI003FD339C3
MFAEVDVFVGNNMLVDPEVYQFWLNGYTAEEAAAVLQNHGVLKQSGLPPDLLISDVTDHYRTFQMLERWLHYPSRLTEQWNFQMAPPTQKMLVEKYYEFDTAVIREFLGKKLSSRNRKDLDDVSEKTGVDIKSCRRQFDNVKRVYKAVEETTGFLVQNIQAQFHLPEKLAKKYAAVVYITNNRFETGKKKLMYLTIDDFLYCANEMMINWACPIPDCRYEETAMDMDREFLQDLRDMKILVEKDALDEQKSLIMSFISGKVSDKIYNDLDCNFKNLSRTIVNIAYGLNHSKEMKDLFVDLVEKVIEPCRQARWTKRELQLFLESYRNSPQQMPLLRSESHLLYTWDRYITTVSSCILKMYHS